VVGPGVVPDKPSRPAADYCRRRSRRDHPHRARQTAPGPQHPLHPRGPGDHRRLASTPGEPRPPGTLGEGDSDEPALPPSSDHPPVRRMERGTRRATPRHPRTLHIQRSRWRPHRHPHHHRVPDLARHLRSRTRRPPAGRRRPLADHTRHPAAWPCVFIRWTVARRLTSKLTVPPKPKTLPSHFLDEDEYNDQLRRCLNDDTLPLEVRVAGTLVMLYALPVTRIVELTTDRLHREDDGTYLTLDRHPVLLPPKLARLIEQQPRGRDTPPLSASRPTRKHASSCQGGHRVGPEAPPRSTHS
jgi:hypothetical protein